MIHRKCLPGNPAAQEAGAVRNARTSTIQSGRRNGQQGCDEIPQPVGQQHTGHKAPTLSRPTEYVYAAIAAVLLRPLSGRDLNYVFTDLTTSSRRGRHLHPLTLDAARV